jgi:hypothetical protein
LPLNQLRLLLLLLPSLLLLQQPLPLRLLLLHLPRKQKRRPMLLSLLKAQHRHLRLTPRRPRLQQHLPLPSLPHLLQASNYTADDEDDDIGIDTTDVHVGYRRRSLEQCDEHCKHHEDELSEYVKTRLLIARLLALRKRQEVWG